MNSLVRKLALNVVEEVMNDDERSLDDDLTEEIQNEVWSSLSARDVSGYCRMIDTYDWTGGERVKVIGDAVADNGEIDDALKQAAAYALTREVEAKIDGLT